jgi:hypothetical protein
LIHDRLAPLVQRLLQRLRRRQQLITAQQQGADGGG